MARFLGRRLLSSLLTLVIFSAVVFFMASAIASFTLTTTDQAINIAIVNSGTFLQLFDDHPSDTFHVYAIEWEEGEIRWYVDDVLFSTLTVGSGTVDTAHGHSRNVIEMVRTIKSSMRRMNCRWPLCLRADRACR